MIAVPVIHAITNDEVLLRDDFLQQAKSIMGALGSRGAVHVRAGWLSARRIFDLTRQLVEWERETGCWTIVNDRVDIACAADAHAVQLTSKSVSVADARALRAALRIGVSVHSLAAALAAEASGANWCIAGPAYATASHPHEEAAGLGLITDISSSVRLPVIAIGGIVPDLLPELRTAGAYGVAAIRGVWHASDVGEAARRYLSSYDACDGVG